MELEFIKESESELIRPGNGKIDWNGEVKGTTIYNGKEMRIIEYCGDWGDAGVDVHKWRGIEDNREPICEKCETTTLRHTTVSMLKGEG